jgi:hypothetical protein
MMSHRHFHSFEFGRKPPAGLIRRFSNNIYGSFWEPAGLLAAPDDQILQTSDI